MNRTAASRSRRHRRERGTALVEFALVVPFLALLVFGALEFAMAWRDSLTVSSSTRAGARVASTIGSDRLADYETLLAIQSSLGDIAGTDVVGVLVYEASAADGKVPAVCFAGGSPQSVSGTCNYYDATQLTALTAGDTSDFAGTTTCDVAAWDSAWCPLDREDRQSLGLTYVGVWIRVRHELVTGLFPDAELTITDHAVMRVEPRP